MTIAINYYYALMDWKQRQPGRDLEFTKNNPSAWNMIQQVTELRRHG